MPHQHLGISVSKQILHRKQVCFGLVLHSLTNDSYHGKCKDFLMQSFILFAHSPSVYPRDVDKITLLQLLLTGRVLIWVTATFSFTFTEYENDSHKVFDHPISGEDTGKRLLLLTQGRHIMDLRFVHSHQKVDGFSSKDCFARGSVSCYKQNLHAVMTHYQSTS